MLTQHYQVKHLLQVRAVCCKDVPSVRILLEGGAERVPLILLCPRYDNTTEEGQYTLTPQKALELVDENTIGIAAILGSTYNGEFDDIQGLNDELLKLNSEKGYNVEIHVDAASGGFIAPFIYPDFVWDFRLPLVCR